MRFFCVYRKHLEGRSYNEKNLGFSPKEMFDVLGYDADESTRDSFNSIRLDGFDSEFDSSLAHRIAIGKNKERMG